MYKLMRTVTYVSKSYTREMIKMPTHSIETLKTFPLYGISCKLCTCRLDLTVTCIHDCMHILTTGQIVFFFSLQCVQRKAKVID